MKTRYSFFLSEKSEDTNGVKRACTSRKGRQDNTMTEERFKETNNDIHKKT